MSAKAKLGNPKHEEFCDLVARGVKQGHAYFRVYGSKNDGAASRMNQKYKDRIAQLKSEKYKDSTPVALTDDPETLAAYGVSRVWVVEQLHALYVTAKDTQSLSDAHKILLSIEKLRAFEEKLRAFEENLPADEQKQTATAKIDVFALGNILDKVTALVSAAKEPDRQMKDVTPLPELSKIKAVRASELEE